MRRESPVRFLGGGGAVMRRCYPTTTVSFRLNFSHSIFIPSSGKRRHKAAIGVNEFVAGKQSLVKYCCRDGAAIEIILVNQYSHFLP